MSEPSLRDTAIEQAINSLVGGSHGPLSRQLAAITGVDAALRVIRADAAPHVPTILRALDHWRGDVAITPEVQAAIDWLAGLWDAGDV